MLQSLVEEEPAGERRYEMTARDDDAREAGELERQRGLVREMVGTMLHEVMEEVVTRYLGAEPHRRAEERRGNRKGRKGRRWKTQLRREDGVEMRRGGQLSKTLRRFL